MLTEKEIKALQPKEKTYFVADMEGLYLRISPNGNKAWIYRIRSTGKDTSRTIGAYPKLPLRSARVIIRRQADEASKAPTFGKLLTEWQEHVLSRKSDSYIRSMTYKINKYMPRFTAYRLNEITPRMILDYCREREEAGQYETAHRIKQIISQVYDYAVILGEAGSNPAALIGKALQPNSASHYPTLTDAADIARLMTAVKAYKNTQVRCAALLSIYTFCRQNEICKAAWSEISGDIWTIPPERMKMRREHRVPLSRQALAVLEQLPRVSRYVFPSARDLHRPMSAEAVRIALRTIGFTQSEITPHGFRSMASTILNEHGFNKDVIELQLAHVDKDRARAIYNRADYWDKRVELMQWYADYLDNAADEIRR